MYTVYVCRQRVARVRNALPRSARKKKVAKEGKELAGLKGKGGSVGLTEVALATNRCVDSTSQMVSLGPGDKTSICGSCLLAQVDIKDLNALFEGRTGIFLLTTRQYSSYSKYHQKNNRNQTWAVVGMEWLWPSKTKHCIPKVDSLYSEPFRPCNLMWHSATIYRRSQRRPSIYEPLFTISRWPEVPAARAVLLNWSSPSVGNVTSKIMERVCNDPATITHPSEADCSP